MTHLILVFCSFCANVDSNNSQKVAWSQDPAELSDYLP